MKFNFTDMSDFMHYFVIEGSAKLGEATGKSVNEIWPEMFQRKVPKVQEWELEVKLNGVELPADKVFEHMESQMDEYIAKKAAQLIREKFSRIYDMMDDIEEMVIDRVQEEFTTFNLKEDE
jgi:hypothetical protein